ncbi:MAG: trigger factor [Patescibacteria group bacterium]
MTPPKITNLPKSQVEIKFTVEVEEAKPYLDQAVAEISTAKPIKGFRPGKAGYDDVSREYGEMLIWETALERIVRAKYVKTILEHDIEAIGSPQIAVDKLVPGQNLEFTVTANVMPRATEIMDFAELKIEPKKHEVSEDETEKAIQDLRKMRRVEVLADKPLTLDDLAIIDLEITKDGVAIEGGSSRDYKVYLNEPHYIPGFSEKLVGATKGETRKFELEFPKEHYTKQLAGSKAGFTATIKDVYELQVPELNDEFAKGFGLESLAKLQELLKQNLQAESDHKTDEAAEIEMLEKLVKGSRFSEIPDTLVNEEVHRMLHELEHGIEEQGMRMEDYLTSLKRTKDELKLDFVPQAIQRIQTAVLLREVSKREKIEVTEQELDAEIDRILERVKPEDKETRERVISADYRDYVAAQMKNRKTLELLKEKVIKK